MFATSYLYVYTSWLSDTALPHLPLRQHLSSHCGCDFLQHLGHNMFHLLNRYIRVCISSPVATDRQVGTCCSCIYILLPHIGAAIFTFSLYVYSSLYTLCIMSAILSLRLHIMALIGLQYNMTGRYSLLCLRSMKCQLLWGRLQHQHCFSTFTSTASQHCCLIVTAYYCLIPKKKPGKTSQKI